MAPRRDILSRGPTPRSRPATNSEARKNFADLFERADQGEEITIMRADTVYARIGPADTTLSKRACCTPVAKLGPLCIGGTSHPYDPQNQRALSKALGMELFVAACRDFCPSLATAAAHTEPKTYPNFRPADAFARRRAISIGPIANSPFSLRRVRPRR
ncbi:hypothetical protein GFL21_16350 [Rhizobium anhuiense]|nr:hypothetical protein [Rhizobium anhuiense]